MSREIEHAMMLERNIVPLLMNDFKFEDHLQYFTGKLEELRDYDALPVPHIYFDAAMEKLRNQYLTQSVAGIIQPTPSDDQPIITRMIKAAINWPKGQ